jgi:hypothetical protein
LVGVRRPGLDCVCLFKFLAADEVVPLLGSWRLQRYSLKDLVDNVAKNLEEVGLRFKDQNSSGIPESITTMRGFGIPIHQ